MAALNWIWFYFAEGERIFVIDGVEAVSGDHSRAEFFADGVGRKTVHVHLDVRSHFLIGQELAGDHLNYSLRRDKRSFHLHGWMDGWIDRFHSGTLWNSGDLQRISKNLSEWPSRCKIPKNLKRSSSFSNHEPEKKNLPESGRTFWFSQPFWNEAQRISNPSSMTYFRKSNQIE